MADERLQKEIDALRADIARLGEDMAEITKVIRALGEERVEGVKASVGEKVGAASEELQRRAEAAREQARRATEGFEKTVEQYPFSSLLAAFGVGILVARLLDIGGRR
ncbi:MAG TPA: DUF883 family protein [Gammaproteobacteria bacterium]|nr:DUF883 family protein [Gammaproteobacteria bacterium]